MSIEKALGVSVRSAFGEQFISVSNDGAGVDEALLDDVRSLGGVFATPVIYASADLQQPLRGRLQIIGLDLAASNGGHNSNLIGSIQLLSDPLLVLGDSTSLIVSQGFADSHDVSLGDTLLLLTPTGVRSFTIRGLVVPPEVGREFATSLVFMDVYGAQEVFARRHFDELIVPAPEESPGETLEALRGIVDTRGHVALAGRDGGGAEAMLRGLHVGLSLIGSVAVGLGMCLVYGFTSLAVLSRSREIAAIRALGLTGGGIRRLLLGEALLFSGLALSAGWLLGVALAWALLPLAQSGMDGYVRDVHLEMASLTVGQILRLGSVACIGMVCGAILPVRSATKVSISDGLAGYTQAVGATQGVPSVSVRRPLDGPIFWHGDVRHRHRTDHGVGVQICEVLIA